MELALDNEVVNQANVIELLKIIEELKAILAKSSESYEARILELETQVKWFKKQIFGAKSDKSRAEIFPVTAEQLKLVIAPPLPIGEKKNPETIIVPKHERKKSNKIIAPDNAGESGLRFGPEVQVVEVPVANPATAGLRADEYEIISEKVLEQLCQNKSAYYVKRYRMPVVKLKETGEVVNAPAPERVIDSPYADISILVGLIADKFIYHQPLYRQHQKMKSAGIQISRATLTTWVLGFIALFEPIYRAQQLSILESKVISMDESPHKAGKKKNEQHMATCYNWFVYGDKKEVFIHSASSRGLEVAKKLLFADFKGVLLADGYAVYEALAQELGITLANCMAHARRKFVEAQEQEPESSAKAVALIARIYEQEALAPPEREKKLEHRLSKIKPIADELFEWLRTEQMRLQKLPKTSYSKAVNYASERETSLTVFLFNPDVPLDNNHTERTVRPLVLGRKNYLFCWSEIGADMVAIIQSLIITCQLHQIDPWEYLTDVAQRISTHPQSKIHELIPRNWKALFFKAALTKQQIPELIAA